MVLLKKITNRRANNMFTSTKLTDKAVETARKRCGELQGKINNGFVVPVLNGHTFGIGAIFEENNIIKKTRYKHFHRPDGKVKIEYKIVTIEKGRVKNVKKLSEGK
jgi:hypothetical protein